MSAPITDREINVFARLVSIKAENYIFFLMAVRLFRSQPLTAVKRTVSKLATGVVKANASTLPLPQNYVKEVVNSILVSY